MEKYSTSEIVCVFQMGAFLMQFFSELVKRAKYNFQMGLIYFVNNCSW